MGGLGLLPGWAVQKKEGYIERADLMTCPVDQTGLVLEFDRSGKRFLFGTYAGQLNEVIPESVILAGRLFIQGLKFLVIRITSGLAFFCFWPYSVIYEGTPKRFHDRK